MSNLNCFLCAANMNEEITEIKTKWGNYELVIKGVNGYVCPECGEKMFGPKEVDMIQNLTESLSELNRIEKPDILNVEEVAEELRVSGQTIYNMIKNGRLKAFKAGREWRFNRKDVESIKKGGLIAAARGENITKKDTKAIKEELDEM